VVAAVPVAGTVPVVGSQQTAAVAGQQPAAVVEIRPNPRGGEAKARERVAKLRNQQLLTDLTRR
jgi:hypothetical protein